MGAGPEGGAEGSFGAWGGQAGRRAALRLSVR